MILPPLLLPSIFFLSLPPLSARYRFHSCMDSLGLPSLLWQGAFLCVYSASLLIRVPQYRPPPCFTDPSKHPKEPHSRRAFCPEQRPSIPFFFPLFSVERMYF